MKQLAEQMLRACGLTDAHRELIRLYGLHGTADVDAISCWFDSVDFEALPPECVCMAAVMGAENGYRGVPEYLLPRLKGILRYHRMLNTGLYAAMCRMIRIYNQHDIDVLVLKGAAIKIGYRANFVRPMWDVDILVRPQDYDRAYQLAQEQGYVGSWSPHSIDLHRGSTESIDLHSVYLRDLRSRKCSDYWPQCREITWNDARFFVPDANSLLLQLMANAHTNFLQHTGRTVPLRWIMDLDALLYNSNAIDWNQLVQLAKQLQVTTPLSVILAAYNNVLPGRVDADTILRQLDAKKESKRSVEFMLRYHRVDRIFRNPPPDCSTTKLVFIHIRWLWMTCRTENPGSWFHGLRTFPRFLCEELRVKSLLELPAVALRKIRKKRSR